MAPTYIVLFEFPQWVHTQLNSSSRAWYLKYNRIGIMGFNNFFENLLKTWISWNENSKRLWPHCEIILTAFIWCPVLLRNPKTWWSKWCPTLCRRRLETKPFFFPKYPSMASLNYRVCTIVHCTKLSFYSEFVRW